MKPERWQGEIGKAIWRGLTSVAQRVDTFRDTESMPTPPSHEVTQLLIGWSEGDQTALDKLIPLVYEDLRQLAHRYLRQERRGHPLQTTALVHEAYMRLIDSRRVRWQNRAHFYAISAQVMRRILVDLARSRNCNKRGGKERQVSLDEALLLSREKGPDLAALDDALTALAAFDPRKSRVVELRFFGGMSVEETAQVLKISPDTVMNDWKLAKLWLPREISRNVPDEK